MNPRYRPVLFMLLLVGVSLATCLLTGHLIRRPSDHEDIHELLHRQLGITPDQAKAIEAVEQRFAARRHELTARIRSANGELAKAMIELREPSGRASVAVKKIHEAQAELQQVTLDHVFEMRHKLRPDQYDKLLKLSADALQGGGN